MRMSKENLSINLRVIRPFFSFLLTDCLKQSKRALVENYRDLEMATLAYGELTHGKKLLEQRICLVQNRSISFHREILYNQMI